jgi:hypothetical protein
MTTAAAYASCLFLATLQGRVAVLNGSGGTLGVQAGDKTLEEVGTKLRSLAQEKGFVLLLDNAEDCLANAAAADQLSALVSKVRTSQARPVLTWLSCMYYRNKYVVEHMTNKVMTHEACHVRCAVVHIHCSGVDNATTHIQGS